MDEEGEDEDGKALKLKELDERYLHVSVQAAIGLAFIKLGLGNTPAKIADWRKLCTPKLRPSVDWTTATLPGINPFFEVYFFGGKTGNHPVEQHFSTFGNHVEDEQSEALKEALSVGAIHLAAGKVARCAPALRKRLKKGGEGEDPPADQRLKNDSDTRAQLQMRGQQLVAHIKRDVPAALENFRKDRELAWKMLQARELKVLSGNASEKRRRGRIRRVADPYGEQRMVIRGKAVQVCADLLEPAQVFACSHYAHMIGLLVPQDYDEMSCTPDPSDSELEEDSEPVQPPPKAHAEARWWSEAAGEGSFKIEEASEARDEARGRGEARGAPTPASPC